MVDSIYLSDEMKRDLVLKFRSCVHYSLSSTLTDRLSKEAIRERRVKRRDLEARDYIYTLFNLLFKNEPSQ